MLGLLACIVLASASSVCADTAVKAGADLALVDVAGSSWIWEELAGGLWDPTWANVIAIATHGDFLYIGGQFQGCNVTDAGDHEQTSSGATELFLGNSFQPSTWSRLGTGLAMQGSVGIAHAALFYGTGSSQFCFGGDFASAGGRKQSTWLATRAAAGSSRAASTTALPW